MNKDSIYIFISGDFAPRMRVDDAINAGNYQLLFNDILPIIRESDISVTNLESPLIETGHPIAKTGPNLKSPLKSIEALKYAGFDLVTLANNHLMDYGEEGLQSTIKVCEENGIRHLGAGENLSKASEAQLFNIKGTRVAFINCCENEWSTTTGVAPGCNPLDEIGLYYQIKEAKGKSDYVIVMIHGGNENYEYPSPRMKNLYRWFIDLGVDAVVGHHTHCFSGYEVYREKPIFYSLGNFLFDGKQRTSSWNAGAAVKITLNSKQIDFELYPYSQCDENVGIKLLDGTDKQNWLCCEQRKSEVIQNDALLQAKFDAYVSSVEKQYSSYLEQSSCSLIQAAKNRGVIPRNVRGRKKLLYLNILRSEAHRDVVLKVLSKK